MKDLWIEQILDYNLPNLRTLDFSLGTGYYGAFEDVHSFTKLFSGDIFPKLTQLGLKDSDKTEELVYELANSPLLDRLETLDLSKGTLTDEGMGILLNSQHLGNLRELNIEDNQLESEWLEIVKEKLPNLSIVGLHNQRQSTEDWRYNINFE